MILLVINNEGRRRPSDIFFKIKNLEHLLLFSIPKTANFEQSENKTASGPCPYIWGAWPLACTYSDCGRLAVPGYRISRLEVVPLLILYCNSRKKHMKRMLSMLLMLLVSMVVAAQDVIVKKDGSTILSKVVEISDTQVKYKKFSHLEGPTYVVSISELTSINYENGEKENFESSQATVTQTQTPSVPSYENAYGPYVQQSGTMSDTELLKAYKRSKAITNPSRIKKLKITGYVFCGLAAVGAVMTGVGIDEWGFDGTGIIGSVLLGSSFFIGPACLIASNHKQKINNSMSSASIFQQEIPIGSNARLTADVNLLKDNFTKQQTVGLGFHLNF